ncbi:MAG: ribonuclease III [Eggerthellaceae bacterium]|nr:ribonuclease III [Eggerthellaceae bacterium]
MDERIERLEAAIGYEFKNNDLALAAITHPSATEGKPITANYQRLEFLGDAILCFVLADNVFWAFPQHNEGQLTRIKLNLCSGEFLSKVGKELGFQDIIIFGKSETGTSGRGLNKALEDVYESVVAAIYLDAGRMRPVKTFIKRTILPYMNADLANIELSPKSDLQIKLQQFGKTPSYSTIDESGPSHNKTFTVQVLCNGKAIAKGTGKSKKEAENVAAKNALKDIQNTISNMVAN